MLFHTLPFFVLLAIVLVGNATITNQRVRLGFLLASSYIFYTDDSLINALFIIFSTVTAYVTGRVVANSSRKKLYLGINLFINFGMLFFFKSYDTFFPYLKNIFPSISYHSFSLPLGLSFYTFQAVSYAIDVSRNDINPEKNFLDFALYISFFPQLIAGPIERAKDLLPQFKSSPNITYNDFKKGALYFGYGLIKKLIIADRLGAISEFIFKDWATRSSVGLLFGGYAIAIQYYCDFSAYSEMALGIGHMMGIKLSRNFNFPFLSSSPLEFWRRWHMTLMSWLHDYLFMPILKLNFSFFNLLVATLIVFLFSGIWHGVGLNYVLWGLLNGFFVIANIIFKYLFKGKKNKFLTPFKIFGTFHIFVLMGLFLYETNVNVAFKILYQFFSFKGYDLSFIYKNVFYYDSIISLTSVSLLFAGEIFFSKHNFWSLYERAPLVLRWTLYTTMILTLILYSFSRSKPYVYYKF